MAIMQHDLIFGDVHSVDYGIYISGEGVFDAPEREVEMISIPGRNGAFALDKGRFENIEVTYPAIVREEDLASFTENLDAFRNAICSQKGYQRLTDSFHPDEYRMATYISGLEVKPIKYNTAAEFDIVFNCKPQRYLMSGESELDITSGDIILNPTMFEANPMLEVEGYGNIDLNGYGIELTNVTLGNITLADEQNYQGTGPSFSTALLEDSDVITLEAFTVRLRVKASVGSIQGVSVNAASGSAFTFDSSEEVVLDNKNRRVDLMFGAMASDGILGDTPRTCTLNVNVYYVSGSGSWSDTYVMDVTIKMVDVPALGPNMKRITISIANLTSSIPSIGPITAVSTQTLLGHPTYIDCDIGEAYKVVDGTPISLNGYIDLGSKLPELSPGANTITFDNTITDLKVVPHWWKV